MSVRYSLCLRELLVVLLLMLAACSGESNQTQPVTTTTNAGTSTAPPAKEVGQRNNTLVRFIHAVPGLAALDLFVNDIKVIGEARYKAVTPYSELTADTQAFRLRLAGQEGAEPLAEEKESFGTGKHYTVIAVPTSATMIFSKDAGQNAQLRFLGDDLVAPASGKTRLRVIQTSPDLNEVDVFVTDHSEALLKGVEFGADTKYAEFEPVSGTLEVRRAGENIATLTVPNVRFEAGKIYTVLVIGRTKGTAKLESVIVEDQISMTDSR